MAEAKRYYWIKLKTDFFADDSPMDLLLAEENGAEYVCLYIKLCLMTANRGGRLCNEVGEMLIPYNVEKIARDMKHFSVDTVRVALGLYKKMNLIYEESDGVLAITGAEDMVGCETKWAKYKRNERNGHSLDNVQQRLDIRDKSLDIRDKDIRDKELDIEVCVDKPKRQRFVPPAIDEVKTFIFENNYSVDAERWFSYYEANGWMVGRNKMKDWKASVRYWNKDAKKKPKGMNDCQTIEELQDYWSKL